MLLLHGLVAFSSLLAERGHVVSSHVVTRRSSSIPADVLTRIESTPGDDFYEIDIRLTADGHPAVRILERFSGGILKEPLAGNSAADSVLKLSDTHFTVPIDHAVATLQPAVAGHGELESIGVAPGAPYQGMEEVLYSADNRPLVLNSISVNPAMCSTPSCVDG